MTLLAVERIKLFSTRSPYWCSALALVLGVGLTAIFAAATDGPVPLGLTQIGSSQLAIAVVLVMAALAVTTEYRFNTIRSTFLAVPNRTSAPTSTARRRRIGSSWFWSISVHWVGLSSPIASGEALGIRTRSRPASVSTCTRSVLPDIGDRPARTAASIPTAR